jgi:hypothetical protein
MNDLGVSYDKKNDGTHLIPMKKLIKITFYKNKNKLVFKGEFYI